MIEQKLKPLMVVLKISNAVIPSYLYYLTSKKGTFNNTFYYLPPSEESIRTKSIIKCCHAKTKSLFIQFSMFSASTSVSFCGTREISRNETV